MKGAELVMVAAPRTWGRTPRRSCSTGTSGRPSRLRATARFEQLWSPDQVAQYLAATKTLHGWRCRKYGPPSYRLGDKVRYRPEEVRAWVDAQNGLAS